MSSRFEEMVKDDTPRLMIRFDPDVTKEKYEWAVQGDMPLLPLVGAIIKTQLELFNIPKYQMFLYGNICPEPMLIIAYDKETKRFNWFIHDDASNFGMVGMLEIVKTKLLQVANSRQQSIQPISGASGLILPNPFRRDN